MEKTLKTLSVSCLRLKLKRWVIHLPLRLKDWSEISLMLRLNRRWYETEPMLIFYPETKTDWLKSLEDLFYPGINWESPQTQSAAQFNLRLISYREQINETLLRRAAQDWDLGEGDSIKADYRSRFTEVEWDVDQLRCMNLSLRLPSVLLESHIRIKPVLDLKTDLSFTSSDTVTHLVLVNAVHSNVNPMLRPTSLL